MEIADIFVVNKSDRPGADAFVKNLRQMLAPAFSTHKKEIPVIKTVAHEHKGIEELFAAIEKDLEEDKTGEKKSWLLAERLYYLLQKERMRDVSKTVIREKIKEELINGPVNLYRLLETFR
jgi:LAO/AO transport system kinase